jgi:hypothetical protein
MFQDHWCLKYYFDLKQILSSIFIVISYFQVTPIEYKQQYSITYPPSGNNPFTESFKSFGLQSLSSSITTEQLRTNNKQQQKQSLSIVPISSDHLLSSSSINDFK